MLVSMQKAIAELDAAVTRLCRNPQARGNVARYERAVARVADCTLAEVRMAIAMQGEDSTINGEV